MSSSKYLSSRNEQIMATKVKINNLIKSDDCHPNGNEQITVPQGHDRQSYRCASGTLGFTLAEILVTLTIIGIVACITIPVVIQNAQNSQFVQAFKNSFYQLGQAYGMIKVNNSDSIMGAFADTNSMMQAFCNEITCVTQCPANSANGVCFFGNTTSYHLLNGAPGVDTSQNLASAVINNGASIAFVFSSANCTGAGYQIGGVNAQCGLLYIDVNGFHAPNVLGRDIFQLVLTQNSLTTNQPNNTGGGYLNGCDSSNATSTGNYCSTRVMMDNAINY